jgi:hypothetical protein
MDKRTAYDPDLNSLLLKFSLSRLLNEFLETAKDNAFLDIFIPSFGSE